MYLFITGVSARTEHIYSYSDDINGVIPPPLLMIFFIVVLKYGNSRHETCNDHLVGLNVSSINYLVTEISTCYVIVLVL